MYGSTVIKDGKCTTVKVGKKKKTTCEDVTKYDYTIKSTVQFEVVFTDARNSGQQSLLEVVSDVKCASGVQPKFTNEVDPQCTVSRTKIPASTLREKTECSNRGLCNKRDVSSATNMNSMMFRVNYVTGIYYIDIYIFYFSLINYIYNPSNLVHLLLF